MKRPAASMKRTLAAHSALDSPQEPMKRCRGTTRPHEVIPALVPTASTPAIQHRSMMRRRGNGPDVNQSPATLAIQRPCQGYNVSHSSSSGKASAGASIDADLTGLNKVLQLVVLRTFMNETCVSSAVLGKCIRNMKAAKDHVGHHPNQHLIKHVLETLTTRGLIQLLERMPPKDKNGANKDGPKVRCFSKCSWAQVCASPTATDLAKALKLGRDAFPDDAAAQGRERVVD